MAIDDRMAGTSSTETSSSAGEARASFVFYSPELKQRLDLLRHLVENSEMIPLVKGPLEAGKSTLIRELLDKATDTWQPALLTAGPTLQPEQFYLSLADFFSVRADEGYLADALLRKFGSLYQNGILPVVVIDDAHLLPEATLAVMLELQTRAPREIRFLLFAEPSMEELLTQLRNRNLDLQPLQELDMPRLNREHTEQYVNMLLQARGDSPQSSVLTESQMERVVRESEGLPGRVARLVDEIKGPGMQARLRGVPITRIAGAALVVVVVLALLIFQDAINALFGVEEEEMPTAQVPRQERVVPLKLPQVPPEPVAPKLVDESATETMPAGDAETMAAEPMEPAGDTAGSEPPPAPDDAKPPQAEGEASVTEEAPVSAPPEEPSGAEEDSEVAEQPETPEQQQGATIETAAESVKEGADEPQSPVAAPAPETEETTQPDQTAMAEKAPVPEAEQTGIKTEAWLLRQNPGSYTLQLAGMRDKAGVPRMIELYKLPGPFAYYRTTRGGGPWYPVLYGVYSNHKAALAERDRLMAAYGFKGLWARSFSSIQKEIRAR